MDDKIKDFYRLQDGTQADPADCEKGKDGVLRHKNGMAVALTENGDPQRLGSDSILHGNVAAVEAGKKGVAAAEAAGEQTNDLASPKPTARPLDIGQRPAPHLSDAVAAGANQHKK